MSKPKPIKRWCVCEGIGGVWCVLSKGTPCVLDAEATTLCGRVVRLLSTVQRAKLDTITCGVCSLIVEKQALKKDNQNLKLYLTALTKTVRQYSEFMEEVMKGPSTVERGRKIAKLLNSLNNVNDHALYFGLGYDYRKDCKRAKDAR
jgi:hypothetical protein